MLFKADFVSNVQIGVVYSDTDKFSYV